jgi:uroporphyrinogen-III decarboxylase
MYRVFCLPQIREYCDILHAAGKLKVDHAVGEPFGAILHDIPDSGVDCLMGFREETAGNVTLEDVRRAWQGRLCLMGGIDSDTLCRLRGDAAQEKFDSFIGRLKASDRFVLSTNSAIMPGTPTRNLEMVGESLRGHLSRARPRR